MKFDRDTIVAGLSEFSRANEERCGKAFHVINCWSPTDWACAVAGEVGEACNLIKKRRRGEIVDDQDIAKELADVVTYVDLLATRLGIDLAKVLCDKFNEVSERLNSEVRIG